MLEIQKASRVKARAIALYLPQFHPIPENNQWWGEGFTEWTNVGKAKPLYRGHYQPHIPADLGYYDLRVPEVRQAQAYMARQYGIEAFCYYHYWFAGQRLLERPFNEVLLSREPDFPFCLCWANETWSGIWHGAPNKILVEQTYPGQADHQAHFAALLPAFQDARYVRVNGEPLFLIYQPRYLPDSAHTLAFWQRMARDAGLGGLHLVGVTRHPADDLTAMGYNAAASTPLMKERPWPPRSRPITWLKHHMRIRNGLPSIYDYDEFMGRFIGEGHRTPTVYPTVVHAWDNTPRSGGNGMVLDNASPEKFREILRVAIASVANNEPDKRIVFIKSWNEWAEGNHLEPDLKFGRSYLEATRSALMD